MSGIAPDSPAAAALRRQAITAETTQAASQLLSLKRPVYPDSEAVKAATILADMPNPPSIAEVDANAGKLQAVQDRALSNSGPESRIPVSDIDTDTLVNFAKALFPPEKYEQIAGTNAAANIRNYFERYYTKNQCEGAMKNDPFRPGKSLCWICGFAITDVYTTKPSGFSYECEHIFPIAQAVFFADLYAGEGVKVGSPPEVVTLEYDHAHRVCNQVKGKVHFLESFTDSGGQRVWNISKPRIRDFLEKLWNNEGYYRKDPPEGNLIQKAVGTENKATWINLRTDEMERRCRKLLDATGCNEAPGLFILASTIKCSEPRDVKRLRYDKGTNEMKVVPHEESPAKRRNIGSGRKTRRPRRRTKKTRRHLPK